MDERATGLIVRTRLLTETSLIVHWLTAEAGRIATVAKGARRPKSAFRGKLDLFHLAEFSFQRSVRSDLHTLKELVVRDSHSALRQDLSRLRQASYCTALIELATEVETPLAVPFQQLVGLLDCLQNRPAQPALVFAFELKLLQELGICPPVRSPSVSPGTTAAMRYLLCSSWASLGLLQITIAQATEINRFLLQALSGHFHRLPRGRESAIQMSPAAQSPRASG
jgi:DNA repair protein RecO (recombination protein O)